jgi:hypothetical protein
MRFLTSIIFLSSLCIVVVVVVAVVVVVELCVCVYVWCIFVVCSCTLPETHRAAFAVRSALRPSVGLRNAMRRVVPYVTPYLTANLKCYVHRIEVTRK